MLVWLLVQAFTPARRGELFPALPGYRFRLDHRRRRLVGSRPMDTQPATAVALEHIAQSIDRLAQAIDRLGHNRAGTSMGAIEGLAKALEEGLNTAGSSIADALRDRD